MQERAESQYGLVTRTDLVLDGVTRAVRRGLVERGELIPVGRQTFRLAGVPTSARQAVMAACLDTGGVAGYRTAAWMHEVGTFGPGAPPEVVVARKQFDYRLPIAHVHTSTNLPADDLVVIDGIPCLSVARTLFSLAALVPSELSQECVYGLVSEAVDAGKATDPWLWWRLEQIRCRGRNGVSALESILVERSGGSVTESWLERETLAVLRGAGLPVPTCQARIERKGAFVARVDFLYPGRNVIIEVSGHRWHRSRAQIDADTARRRRLTLAGFTVLEYSYDQIVRTPEVLVAEVAQALWGIAAA